MPENMEEQNAKGAMAAIVAGVLVIIAGFLVYNYFSKVSEEPGLDISPGSEIADQEGGGEKNEQEEQDDQGQTENGTNEQNEQDQNEPELGTGGPKGESATWSPNNYDKNDIKGKDYTVKWGDTLWEIAEARYGSGFEWTKIRDANMDKIGTLPNGSQALIEVGQTLTLP